MDCVIFHKNISQPNFLGVRLRKMFDFLQRSMFSVAGNSRLQQTIDGSKAKDKEIEKEEARQMALSDVEKALEQYGNAILRLAYSYLHNMSDAEDILQETLMKYMETTPAFESDSHKKAWLLRVAANLSKNRIDYNRIRQADELEETLIMEEREDLSFVWEAVKNLPEKYREVIHLFYHEGYQTKEISQILNRNESSVRSDLKRGRDSLREVLREAYDFEI